VPQEKGATGGKPSVGLQRLQGISFFFWKGFRLVAYAQKRRGFPVNSKLTYRFPGKSLCLRALSTAEQVCTCVPAEQFRNVRAFLSTWHLHTAGRSVRSYTHKRARLSRTARAGLDRSHPLPATWGHTPRLKRRLRLDKRQTKVAKRPALNLPSSRDYYRGSQCAGCPVALY
jgi:hypothetical protein